MVYISAKERRRRRWHRNMFGRRKSDEHKAAISEGMKKRWQDPEYVEKMRIKNLNQRKENKA